MPAQRRAGCEPSLPFALNKTAADWRGVKSDEGRFLFRYVAKEELAHPGSMHEALGDVAEGAVIASIGGGYGAWLADVLERDPSLKGIVYDAPPVLDDAMRLFDVLEFADRIEFLPGDAREEVPTSADIYVLKSVLQQHDDTDAAAILESCRRAMTPGARLVIYERLMPEDASADPEAIMIDLHMMAITGGKTRTLAEMERLIAGAGLSVAGHRKTADGRTAIDVRTP